MIGCTLSVNIEMACSLPVGYCSTERSVLIQSRLFPLVLAHSHELCRAAQPLQSCSTSSDLFNLVGIAQPLQSYSTSSELLNLFRVAQELLGSERRCCDYSIKPKYNGGPKAKRCNYYPAETMQFRVSISPKETPGTC